MKRIGIAVMFCTAVVLTLQGCAGAVIAGGATGANVAHDRRTTGSFVEDQNIELKAMKALNSDPALDKKAHISVTSYNQIVLLTGEAPSPELRDRAASIVSNIAKVRRVQNEVALSAPSSLGSQTNDTWITAKVKTSLFKVKLENFDPTRVKVVTENGVVYLMGLVTRGEADAVVDVVRKVDGVRRVVKVFEYIG